MVTAPAGAVWGGCARPAACRLAPRVSLSQEKKANRKGGIQVEESEVNG